MIFLNICSITESVTQIMRFLIFQSGSFQVSQRSYLFQRNNFKLSFQHIFIYVYLIILYWHKGFVYIYISTQEKDSIEISILQRRW